MDYLILAFVGFVAAMTPGPDIFYVIRQGLCRGSKKAFIAVAGILSGNIVYLTLVYLGLGSIGKNPYFQAVVGFFGGLYLLRISFLVFREKVTFDKNCSIGKNIYKEALLLNLSNPKAMIFFAVIVTPFLSKNIMLSFVALFSGISFAFITAAFISSKVELEERVLNAVNKTASVVFVAFAVKLFMLSYEALMKIV